MSRGTTVLYGGETATGRLNHCYSTGVCELANNQGVPILQAYASALVRNGKGGRFVESDEREYKTLYTPGTITEEAEITPESRLSFFYAFGVSPDQQHLMEERLVNWSFDPRNEAMDVKEFDAQFRRTA